MEIKRVDGESLDEALLTGRRPLLVYFEAASCAACDLGRPLLEQASAACDGRLEVLRCDVWDAPSAVVGLRLLSLPTAVLFVYGEEVMRLAGVPRRRRLAALIGAGLRAAEAFEMAASTSTQAALTRTTPGVFTPRRTTPTIDDDSKTSADASSELVPHL